MALPKLCINNNQIQRSESIKFLGVFLDENLTWRDHIKYIENKIAKNIGILYRPKPYLNNKCLLSLYYSYIHSYISHANIAWANTYFSNLKKVSSQQKHSVRIIYNKMKYESVTELLISLKILNVYQINILNNASFMRRINTKTAPTVFLSKFTKLIFTKSHIYPTRFSQINYAHKLNRCKYRILIRRPYIWNEFLSNKEKEIEVTSSFKSTIKSKLLSLNNEISYF